MQKKPTVSVIMPTYNEYPVVKGAIQSIIDQSFKYFELIAIDGGSTDGTIDLINNFDDDRITILSEEEPQGISHALNRGIEAAKGKYIARMDADDISRLYRLERQVDVFKSSPSTVVVTCWYHAITRKGDTITTRHIDPSRSFSPTELIKQGPGFAHGSVMIPKTALEKVGGYRSPFDTAEDLDLWLRIAEQFGSDTFHVIPEVLYQRRISPDQMIRRQQQRVVTDYVKEASKCRRNGTKEPLNEVRDTVQNLSKKSYSNSEREALYQYLIGIQYFEEGEILAAWKQFLTAIITYPLVIHPWYKILMSFLPKKSRRRSQQIIRRYVR
jgi:glycosyltransferase involved in cell wall biosynthesis